MLKFLSYPREQQQPRFFVFLSPIVFCLHVFIFSSPPHPTRFDTASMYSTLASVLSFKQWSQAKGTFCFSFAQNQLN